MASKKTEKGRQKQAHKRALHGDMRRKWKRTNKS